MPTYVVTYTVAFAATADRTSGTGTITDTTNYAGQGLVATNCELIWGFTGPDGIVYRPLTQGAPGNILHSPSNTYSFPLPTALGVVIEGDYVFEATLYSAVGPINQYIGTQTEELCIDTPEIVMTPDINCNAAVVALVDDTPWSDESWTVVSREIILHYPLLSFHADITSTTARVATTSGQSIMKGTWSWEATWEVTNGSTTVTASSYGTFEVNCSAASCKRWCQIRVKYGNMALMKSQGAGDQSVNLYRESFERMVVLSITMDGLDGCGQAIPSGMQDEWAVLAGDCGCGCDDLTDIITPLYGSAAGNWLPLAGTWITITPGVGTYTFEVDPAVVLWLSALYNTDVDSPDGSVTVTETVVAGNPTLKTKHLSVTNPPPDSVEITWNVDLENGLESLGSPVITGTFFQAPTIVESVGTFSYGVTGFLVTPTNSTFNASVWIEGRELTGPMNLADRYATILQAQVLFGQWQLGAGNQSFSFALIPFGPSLGTALGSHRLKSWFAGFLKRFSVRIQITKV